VTGCVLIVDDEVGACDVMREAVELAGCSAMVASSGGEALEILASEASAARHPCLVVLDLLMPGMTGAQTFEAMRRDPSLAAIPVVFSTSAPDRAPPGAVVLPKPVDVHALWACIHQRCHCAAETPMHKQSSRVDHG